jgi:hypothetical protein
MIEMAANPRNERIAVTKAAVLSCGGVSKLARKTNSITKSKKANRAQPIHADHTRMYESVSARRSGLSQNLLCGRLITETGIPAMTRVIPNETTVASTMIAIPWRKTPPWFASR